MCIGQRKAQIVGLTLASVDWTTTFRTAARPETRSRHLVGVLLFALALLIL
jgi:hypothetical protein